MQFPNIIYTTATSIFVLIFVSTHQVSTVKYLDSLLYHSLVKANFTCLVHDVTAFEKMQSDCF